MNVDELLQRYPWPAEWLRFGPPIEHFWRIEVPMPKQALWPHLVDTSTLNQRLGLAEMHFREEAGKVFGTQQRSGLHLEWEEVPWEWDYERGLQNARIYIGGPLRYLRARFEVYERTEQSAWLVVYFGGIARSWLGKLVLRYGMSDLGEEFRRVFHQLAASWKAPLPSLPALPARALEEVSALTPESALRLHEIKSAILAAGTRADVAEQIESLVRSGSEDELVRIRVRTLAQRWQLPLREVLLGFLHATRSGLFTLSWDAVCPHCRGPRVELLHLGELPKSAACGPCGIDFDATQMNSLEVAFHIHPAIRTAERRLYCAAQPARKPHVLVQRMLAAGEQVAVPLALPEGRYRLRAHGSKDYLLVDLRTDASTAELHFRGQSGPEIVVVAPRLTLQLENPGSGPVGYSFEQRDSDGEALRPAELFALQEFRDLFSEESIATDVQLDIGMQTILFTDIVGSTRFYEIVGDSKAFAEVRRHFLRAYDCVKRNRGVVVKTIGDAVMAAFADPAGALQAGVELQRIFDGQSGESSLRLRATIHVGRCLAVSLNSNIDYFGSTVNLAAKLLSIADAGELVFTEAVRRDPGVSELLSREGFAVATVPFAMKWSGGELQALRINISGQRRDS